MKNIFIKFVLDKIIQIVQKFFFVFCLLPSILIAQCTIEVTDTFSCNPGAMVVMDAIAIDAFDTENYTITNIPHDPINGLKTQALTIGDDQTIGPFPIGFNFNFFNEQYDEFYICSNGFISFTSGGAPYNAIPIPDVGAPRAAIFAAWEDWNPSWGQGVVRYETLGGIPNRYLVIEYDSVSSYNCGGGSNQAGVWQIILKENSNEIELHIAQKPLCNMIEGVQGIQDETGNIAFTVNGRNDSIWSSFNEGILFSPEIVPVINWYDPNGVLVNTGISGQLFPNESGNYAVELSNSAGCYYTDTFHIQVSYSSPTITQNGNVLLCNEPGFEYQWHLNGNPIDSAVSQFLVPFQNGIYQVSTTDFHDCEVFSDTLVLDALSIDNDLNNLIFYPNPSTNGELYIETTKVSNLSIFTLEGKLVFYKTLSTGDNYLKTNMKRGVYFLKLDNDVIREVRKWIVL